MTTAYTLLACVSGGCYDGQQLIDLARSQALQTKYEEIDLGEFRISLPRNKTTATATEMRFRIFGNVLRHRVDDIEKQLQTDRYRLRYATITTVRQAGPVELSEPNLQQLKSRIAGAVNDILEDRPIESIGFADLRLSYR